jgi:hypothetical protein
MARVYFLAFCLSGPEPSFTARLATTSHEASDERLRRVQSSNPVAGKGRVRLRKRSSVMRISRLERSWQSVDVGAASGAVVDVRGFRDR